MNKLKCTLKAISFVILKGGEYKTKIRLVKVKQDKNKIEMTPITNISLCWPMVGKPLSRDKRIDFD